MKILASALGLLALAAAPAPSPAQSPTPAPAAAGNSTIHDFDFLIGRWTQHHRRLKARLAHSTQWEEFAGHAVAFKTLNGQGNADDNELEAPAGTYYGLSVRTFDPKTRLWAIWWYDSRDPQHDPGPPLVGDFRDGVGTFYANDTFNGRPIRVRYLWTDITPVSCRWQQAFSEDGGRTWETNWIVEFTRAGTS